MREVRISITPHAALDVRGRAIIAAAPTVGVQGVRAACVSDLYFVRGDLSDADVKRLCDVILADPAAHEVRWEENTARSESGTVVEVAYLAGVMDPLALQLARAAHE